MELLLLFAAVPTAIAATTSTASGSTVGAALPCPEVVVFGSAVEVKAGSGEIDQSDAAISIEIAVRYARHSGAWFAQPSGAVRDAIALYFVKLFRNQATKRLKKER